MLVIANNWKPPNARYELHTRTYMGLSTVERTNTGRQY